ncbi:glycosyltransferase family 4 protein [Priestia abyssalis]|uniref:glycosyltransferase family 4 protein n=1 Tax=Priestia abyssalis TaxID=1221450 RepID=UPI000994D2B9|nr:glycosyltransferase family 1 protein [Priestia abyssalis]
MLTVGLDLRVLNNKYRTGVGRYAYKLTQELLKYTSEKYIPITNFKDENIRYNGRLKSDIFNLSRSNIEQGNKLLSLIGDAENIDVLFSPYYPIPQSRNFKGVICINDLIPLKYPEFFNDYNVHSFFNTKIRKVARNVDHIITPSNSTKNDILNYFRNINENKISVIPLASFLSKEVNYKDESKILNKFKVNKPYMLSVCTIEPRKNLARTIKAYQAFRKKYKEPIQLVLVGSLGWKYSDILDQINNCEFKEDVIMTGFISDKEVVVLYQNAELFVYASIYEGFGLPVIEAMSCGVPVVTSNVSSLPEVGGDSVVYCNPLEVESIALAIEKILFSPSLKKELQMKGFRRAKTFSWENTARKTREVFINL